MRTWRPTRGSRPRPARSRAQDTKRLRPPPPHVWLRADVGQPAEEAPHHRPPGDSEQPGNLVDHRGNVMSPQARRHGAATADEQAQAPRALPVALSGTQVPPRQNRAGDESDEDGNPIEQFTNARTSRAPDVSERLGRGARCTVRIQGHHHGPRRIRRRVVSGDLAEQVCRDEQPGTLAIGELDAIIAFSSPPPERAIDGRGRRCSRGGDFSRTLRQYRRRLWQFGRRDVDQVGSRGDGDRSAQRRPEKQPRHRRSECAGCWCCGNHRWRRDAAF